MRSALGFLSSFGGRLLGPATSDPGTPGPATLVWFPLVGALLGATVGAVWWAGAAHWPPLLTGALVVGVDLVLTGLLHVDGLADTADGLLAPMERERRLAVMSQPDVGAFGVAAVAVVLLVRFAAFGQPDRCLSYGGTVMVAAGLWCLARTLMAAAIYHQPYARGDGGLAAVFRDPSRAVPGARWAVPVIGLAGAFVLAAVGEGTSGAVAVAVALVAGIGVLALGQRRLGGFTGDVLGAAGIVAESAGLITVSFR